MAEALVNDWLAEYENLTPSEHERFISMHESNDHIADAIYTILNERLKYPDLVHYICNQFHKFYKSKADELKIFTLQFIPILMYIYLNCIAQGDKKGCRSVETLLIAIYNVEISTDDGNEKVISFRVPVLAQPSVYHEEKSLHPTDLRRWEENCNKEVKWGPHPQIETINAQNRMKVMAILLFAYNQEICLMKKAALFHLCKISSHLVNQGFTTKTGLTHRSSYASDSNSSSIPKTLPRIPVSSQFLIELVHAVYFAMFNDFGTIATQTLEDIHNRACYEMFPDVMLVTNAVRNSIQTNFAGQPSDGPMGLSVALTPVSSTVTVSKSMVTNASFRTKKLPDDIPIQGIKEEPHTTLTSITEENESIGPRSSNIRNSKEISKMPKNLMSGFKKSKDKDSKQNLNKNSNSNDLKESGNRHNTKKDKFLRNSILGSMTDSTDNSNSTKTKYTDITTDCILSDYKTVNNLGNGNFKKEEISSSINNSCDTSDSVISGTEISGIQRPSLALIDSHHVQISQV